MDYELEIRTLCHLILTSSSITNDMRSKALDLSDKVTKGLIEINGVTLTQLQSNEIYRQYRTYGLMRAITLARETFIGLGLKDAKLMVEEIQRIRSQDAQS